MSITATTLSAAMTSTQTTVSLTSATGVTAPNFQTGSGITYLLVDQELMLVTGISGTVASVVRGVNGTPAQSHVSGGQVQIGLPADFPTQQNIDSTLQVTTLTAAADVQPAIF